MIWFDLYSEGNLFVVNHDNSSSGQILKFTSGGLRSTFALGLNNPGNLAFDSAGNLFTVDTGAASINLPRMECEAPLPSGLLSRVRYGPLTPRATCLWQIDASGAIYKFTPTGVQTTFASGLKPAVWPLTGGNLFVGDWVSEPYGSQERSINLLRPGYEHLCLQFVFPVALAFDSRGNLLVADGGMTHTTLSLGAAIYKFTPSGLRSTVASEISSIISALAIDSADNLFVSRQRQHLKFTPSGMRTTFASGVIGFLAFQPILWISCQRCTKQ